MNRRRIIAHEYQDADGYWIELKDGFQNGNDPGTHGIVEDTKRAAYRALTNVKPCECDECLRGMVKNPHAVALGRKGGASTSAEKVRTARENGKKGGRPAKKKRTAG